ncbi:MAG: leucine-rich repeat domain-containing protein [Oscillospiraceae bacterium]|nr:leucine-rich repeat domain-containing protein [Oscillospiraceae bacterium]
MKKFTRFMVPLLLALVIIASIGWYLFVYDRNFTRDALLSQARFHDLHGNSRLSSWFYDLAYEYSGRDENVAIELANQYKADGNYTKAEYTLTNAIHSGGTVELYTALCKAYVEQDKLLDAVTMLENIADPNIKAQLDKLRPNAPTASYAAGFYSQYIDVALASSGDKLYYTIDGEYPSTAGEPYSEPITLPAGETTIYAISVSNEGLVSPLSIIGYTVTGVIEPVSFVDEAMEDAMREAIGANRAEIIYTNMLWSVTEFTVPESTTNLQDLTLMPNLVKLTASGNTLESLEPIASLTRLESLDLSGCRFPSGDLSYLTGLTALHSLSLSDCGLSTIEALAGAQYLTWLDLSKNTVRNLDALSDMTTLTELNLRHNAVTSLSALSELDQLDTLDVSYNALTSLSPIGSCVRLSWLCADNNQLTSISGVERLPLLSYLSMDYNKLKEVQVLSSCTELVNLSFAGNEVSDISMLGGLLKMEVLDFSYNQCIALPIWQAGCALRTIDGSYNKLGSIDGLADLEQIANVYMDYNQLTSVDALADCYHLVQVNVYGNEIEDVSALTAHDIIVNYDPT